MARSVPVEWYSYGYLVGAILYVGVWALLFWRRSDLRSEMLAMSALMALFAVPHEYLIWTRDWWHPPTITGTQVGVEDVLYSIGNGGVLAVLYAVVFRAALVKWSPPPPVVVMALPYVVNALAPPLLFFSLGLHSFLASAVGAMLALALILWRRPELAPVAVGSAILGTAASLPIYWLIEGLLPGFIAATWYLDRLSGVLLIGIPIEDLIWYMYTAALWGTYYKFLVGSRPVSRAVRAPSTPAR